MYAQTDRPANLIDRLGKLENVVDGLNSTIIALVNRINYLEEIIGSQFIEPPVPTGLGPIHR